MLFLLMVLLDTTTKSLEKMLIINNINFTLNTILYHATTKTVRKAGNHVPDTVSVHQIQHNTVCQPKYHPTLKNVLQKR